MAQPTPFKLSVSDELLSFINQRVESARIPPGLQQPAGKEWADGAPPNIILELQEFWKTQFDWRKVEAKINKSLKMFTLPISEAGEDLTIHFVHHRSNQRGAIPLLFLHGWPGSFLEVEKIIDKLTSPADTNEQAYHVVAPSLPGFGFSSDATKPGFGHKKMAAVNNKLMLALGYRQYMAQGGDWGSLITRIQAIDYPENCVALHLNFVLAAPPSPWKHPIVFASIVLGLFSKSEKKLLDRMKWWGREENGYYDIQSTKPQTVSYALVDSPIGMLAWIRDKLHNLVEDDYVWENEDVITWIMMYVIHGTSGNARIYKEHRSGTIGQDLMGKIIDDRVCFGASIFPKDVFYVPKWWAACTVATNIVFWKEHTSGGHFASWEKPTELVEDIREFTKNIGTLSILGKSGES